MEKHEFLGKDKISYWADIDYERHIKRLREKNQTNQQNPKWKDKWKLHWIKTGLQSFLKPKCSL